MAGYTFLVRSWRQRATCNHADVSRNSLDVEKGIRILFHSWSQRSDDHGFVLAPGDYFEKVHFDWVDVDFAILLLPLISYSSLTETRPKLLRAPQDLLESPKNYSNAPKTYGTHQEQTEHPKEQMKHPRTLERLQNH